jgi:hypothetical protein
MVQASGRAEYRVGGGFVWDPECETHSGSVLRAFK